MPSAIKKYIDCEGSKREQNIFRSMVNGLLKQFNQKQYSQNTVERIYWEVSVNFFKPLLISNIKIKSQLTLRGKPQTQRLKLGFCDYKTCTSTIHDVWTGTRKTCMFIKAWIFFFLIFITPILFRLSPSPAQIWMVLVSKNLQIFY